MDSIAHILELLTAERDRVEAAIRALSPGVAFATPNDGAAFVSAAGSHHRRRDEPRHKARSFTKKQRQEQAERMRAYWQRRHEIDKKRAANAAKGRAALALKRKQAARGR